ncbi:hypothetical protein OROMI_012791 [Orobanche minor]
MAAEHKFHPALTVTNIKNFLPLVLEMENGQYSSWAELFRIHCRAFLVIDHIIPLSMPVKATTTTTVSDTESPAKDKESARDEVLWSRLDALVLQWIYGTISNDLLHTILTPNATAHQQWERLESIFQDNKNSRAVYLENQFAQVRLDDFPNVSSYCRELKVLADQLANVGAPISNNRMVLQLIAGLSESYDGVATLIQQSDPLPQFYEARSKLILEETRKAKQAAMAANSSGMALVATNHGDAGDGSTGGSGGQQRYSSNGRGKKTGGGKQNGKGKGQRQDGRGRGGGGSYQQQPQFGHFCNIRILDFR